MSDNTTQLTVNTVKEKLRYNIVEPIQFEAVANRVLITLLYCHKHSLINSDGLVKLLLCLTDVVIANFL